MEQTTGTRTDTGTADSDDEPAVEALRLRFARGELSEAEFERRVQLLQDTEN